MTLKIVADNDVILKAARYRLEAQFWDEPIGYLGAAPYVLADAAAKAGHDPDELKRRLMSFFQLHTKLDPTPEESALAADLEYAAQQANVELDSGESQLAAIAIQRDLPLLETGDKRAIRALAALEDRRIDVLHGRIRCLEQILLRLLAEEDFQALFKAVCSDPGTDTAMRICFSCASGRGSRDNTAGCLASYIADIERDAPGLLYSPGPRTKTA